MSPSPRKKKRSIGKWGGKKVHPGERKRIRLKAGESFTGVGVHLPLMVWRGYEDGPVLGITAAVHGDEINGTGVIRKLIEEPPFVLKRGSLVLVPVVNVMGFERHSRYTPDRRDLNRSFPGSKKGSLTGRLAHLVMKEVISRCDYMVDLHTAAVRRTNFPNVRADMDDPGCELLANAFGAEVIVHNAGPDGSLRREACKAGCPTIILEAGETLKVEPSVQDLTMRGLTHILSELEMIDVDEDDRQETAPHQMIVQGTSWVRAGCGGFLKFHVAPGDTVKAGAAVATNTGLLGEENEVVVSPHDGIVLGMTTMPAVSPGDPIIHVAKPDTSKQFRSLEKSVDTMDDEALESQLRTHLATNITVEDPVEPDDEDEA
ncbi:succinylglutamate desuccinylase/aspartoacylase family protein [Sulfuriroseicoccus oceanibius]|uniref:Succinylglutamate desuccinylase/aspartoacylase family protein n=1 Tax=Sulfuriroseicoccus oceanibius TaxID=2707525 RepID=A0A6B3L5V8_9BACT|nr:succinylglutamate desuccinylase/aspartoacylase family protein [Sulfuriroseicoccus oceanibius]QQL45944.1 succinylglutamate desuccinylase/aspartoacylase family protein [Sulfuriroseicoccus oceanibius]